MPASKNSHESAHALDRIAAARGFTFSELVVVMAIVATLAITAIPGYRGYILRSHRAEATAALLAVSGAQEKYYLQHTSYATALTPAPPSGLGLPDSTASGHYAITITSAGPDKFTARAAAIGEQAADEHCAEFNIDATGLRSATHDDCWTR